MTTEILAKILSAQFQVASDAGMSNPWITVADMAKNVLKNEDSHRVGINYHPDAYNGTGPKNNTTDPLLGGIGYAQD